MPPGVETSPKKLLIVSYYFAPRSEIASVRIVNYAIGLSDLGWNVEVLTVGANPFNPLERQLDLDFPAEKLECVRVIELPPPWEARLLYSLRELVRRFRRGCATASVKARFKVNGRGIEPENSATSPIAPWGLMDRLTRAVGQILDNSYRRVFSQASNLAAEYHAIWSSFGPRCMIDVGIDMANRFGAAAFVMDLRDPVVRRSSSADARELSRQISRERRLATSRVDAITVVSEPCIDDASHFAAPIILIPNGFEPRLAAPGRRRVRTEKPLTIYYGGRLYPTQDVRPLAAACLELSKSRAVRVEYAGNDGAVFAEAFASQGAGQLVVDLGMLPREESITRARAADVAAVFSWNTEARGILTGKVFELIAIDTPIAVIVSGDHTTSALAQLFTSDPMRRVFGDSLDRQAISDLAGYIGGVREISEDVRMDFRGIDKYMEYSHPVLVRRLSECLEKAVQAHSSRATL